MQNTDAERRWQYNAEDNSWGLGEIRTKLENDEYRTHVEFAAAVRKVLDQGLEEPKDDNGIYIYIDI